MDYTKYSILEEKLGYIFKDKSLLKTALTHPSMKQELSFTNYERLEFLGDAVLNIIITDKIFNQFRDLNEGDLAKMKSYLVSKDSIYIVANDLGIEEYIDMTYGEENTGGRENINNVENVTEAVIAALYIDGGMEPAKNFICRYWANLIESYDEDKSDPKTALQNITQKLGFGLPVYKVINRTGPDHRPLFEVSLEVAGKVLENASAGSLRAAQKLAAEKVIASDFYKDLKSKI